MATGEMNYLVSHIRNYRVFLGRLPPTLAALATKLPRGGHAFLDEIPKDPWGREYEYALDAEAKYGFSLWSAGADGRRGTADDVTWSDGR